MAKSLFLIKGNICAERVRLGRALQKPPMTQDDLARKIQFMGMGYDAAYYFAYREKSAPCVRCRTQNTCKSIGCYNGLALRRQ